MPRRPVCSRRQSKVQGACWPARQEWGSPGGVCRDGCACFRILLKTSVVFSLYVFQHQSMSASATKRMSRDTGPLEATRKSQYTKQKKGCKRKHPKAVWEWSKTSSEKRMALATLPALRAQADEPFGQGPRGPVTSRAYLPSGGGTSAPAGV